jgi:hypothetical protein
VSCSVEPIYSTEVARRSNVFLPDDPEVCDATPKMPLHGIFRGFLYFAVRDRITAAFSPFGASL